MSSCTDEQLQQGTRQRHSETARSLLGSQSARLAPCSTRTLLNTHPAQHAAGGDQAIRQPSLKIARTPVGISSALFLEDYSKDIVE